MESLPLEFKILRRIKEKLDKLMSFSQATFYEN